MDSKIKLYDLTPSQEVVKMQLKYSIDKRVINILSSATFAFAVNKDALAKAVNLAVERVDSARLRFVKVKGKLMQYFAQNVKTEIKEISFSCLKEQEKFLGRERKRPIKYLKGKSAEFWLVKTYDGKDMLFVKACHYIFDTYGLMTFYKDIFEVYESIVENKTLPSEPAKFEDVIVRELDKKNDKALEQKRRKFFKEYFSEKPQPYYAGIAGLTTKIAKKSFDKHLMKYFFLSNQTQGYIKDIDKPIADKAFEYCKQKRISPANLMFFAASLCQSKLNGGVKNLLQLELCNCRPTALDRNCAGTKVQSLGCYVQFDYGKSLSENLNTFCQNQNTYYRYVGFSDMEFQAMTHAVWHSSPIKTYYGLTFSYIPVVKPDGTDFMLYSNGKCALPCYFAIMHNVTDNTLKAVYDVQKKLCDQNHVDIFHKNFVSILQQIVSDDSISLDFIKTLK